VLIVSIGNLKTEARKIWGMWSKIVATSLSIVLLGDAALINAAQADIWTERHKNSTSDTHSSSSKQLTMALPASPSELLQQIPSLNKNLPAVMSESVAPLPPNLKHMPVEMQHVLSAIPTNAAKVTSGFTCPLAKRFVVLIQDVHMNTEAQQNILSVLNALS